MIVGIDLGTTHTAVASSDGGEPQLFAIAQVTGRGQLGAEPLLPSCLFRTEEAHDAAIDGWLVGRYARERGGEVAARLVASAKSWLSHAAVDRTAALLPWQLAAEETEAERISPVRASAVILEHVRRAWDAAHPAHPLADQEVVLTVPASFDAVARELTMRAAQQAGLRVRLLEEPQAAFYHLWRHNDLDGLFSGQSTVLVCDVGGGTSDFSLLRVTRGERLAVERIAVGRHLLLGGDNMDLALASMCEARLSDGKLEPRRFAQLVAACRAAKERLLGDDPPDAAPIRLLASGSQLVGGTLKCELTQQEVVGLVLDGFFPVVGLDEPRAARRAGLVAFGLPYEQEPAVTRHLAAFVAAHDETPDALLLNGGVFASNRVCARLRQVVADWRGGPLLDLPPSNPDTSVALGAVAYGLALAGDGETIVGGAARGYYLALPRSQGSSAKTDSAAPPGDGPLVVSVLPRGSKEGVRTRVERTFELTVGKAVRFDLLCAETGVDASGVLLPRDDRMTELPPLLAHLDSKVAERVPVALEAELSAIGTLDVACVELAAPQPGVDPRRFALAFDLRGDAGVERKEGVRSRYGKKLDLVAAAIDHVFGKDSDAPIKDVKGLWRAVEKILTKRTTWPLDLNRAVYDALWRHHKRRRRGSEHERVFWSMAGFTLRPGMGDPRDPERARALFRLFDARLAHPGELRSWEQFWIAWRRVAAGFDEAAQLRMRESIDPFLAPEQEGLKKGKAFRNDAHFEMLDLGGCLERVPAARRSQLGGWILERTWTSRDPRLWAALGRAGARVPTYASLHHVVATKTVERWLDHLLREKWDQVPTAARAAVAMTRMTGDRARDVSDSVRAEVLKRLDKLNAPERLRRPVAEHVALDDAERSDFYGADLPVGLRLAE